MKIKDIKLTDNMIGVALKDSLPAANMKLHEEGLPFKRVIMTKHACCRFEERFGKGYNVVDISKQISASLRNGYYSLTSKDIPSFAVDVNFGEATALVLMSKQWNKFDDKEEIYLVKTLYLKMNEFFIKKMEDIHDEKIKDDIFEKMINDQFFVVKTEKEIFGEINRPSEKIFKRIKKAIHKTHNMIDPIKELTNNDLLLNEIEDKEQYKFGDGIKHEPKPVEKVKYMNRDQHDILDDLLDESLFDIDEVDSKFKFGDGQEMIEEKKSKENPLGLDLDSSDFPW